ncbi:hypothetical protein CoNPh31_CDS0013 [Staphylococcus phage S-CoN_Ph31]|nr:hypothetical protein CoNPh30_CDS0011 [Staphylococcus phage S-CoN_Ph30]WNM55455.1 hypothetical protein CoNPh31_CDS0013 [Staphylococcus phage S-CoN_Ph31]
MVQVVLVVLVVGLMLSHVPLRNFLKNYKTVCSGICTLLVLINFF